MIKDPGEKMQWRRMAEGKCPRCSKMLTQEKKGYPLFCPDKNCGFLISEKRCNEILNNIH